MMPYALEITKEEVAAALPKPRKRSAKRPTAAKKRQKRKAKPLTADEIYSRIEKLRIMWEDLSLICVISEQPSFDADALLNLQRATVKFNKWWRIEFGTSHVFSPSLIRTCLQVRRHARTRFTSSCIWQIQSEIVVRCGIHGSIHLNAEIYLLFEQFIVGIVRSYLTILDTHCAFRADPRDRSCCGP